MQPQNNLQDGTTSNDANAVPTFSPNDPSGNVGGAQSSNPQDFTFQIPKAGDPVPAQSPTPPPTINTVPSFDSPLPTPQLPQQPPIAPQITPTQNTSSSPQETTHMPDMHEPPIFMREDSPSEGATSTPIPPLGTPPAYSVGGPPPQQNPAIQPLQRPVQSASNISQVSIPRRKQGSKFKLIIFVVLGLLITGLLMWAVIAVISSRSSDNDQTSQSTTKQAKDTEYVSEQLGFATRYADGWKQEQTKEDGLDVVTFSHPKIRDNDTAVAEVAVIRLTSAQLKDIPDKETFYSTYQKAITDGFDNYSELDSQELTIDDLPAKRVEADIAQKGEQDQAIFHFIYAGKDGFIIVGYVDKAQFKDLEDELNLVVEKFDNRVAENQSNTTE